MIMKYNESELLSRFWTLNCCLALYLRGWNNDVPKFRPAVWSKWVSCWSEDGYKHIQQLQLCFGHDVAQLYYPNHSYCCCDCCKRFDVLGYPRNDRVSIREAPRDVRSRRGTEWTKEPYLLDKWTADDLKWLAHCWYCWYCWWYFHEEPMWWWERPRDCMTWRASTRRKGPVVAVVFVESFKKYIYIHT